MPRLGVPSVLTPSGIIGYCQYAPATGLALTTTSASMVDVDATNLIVTFTAPASGTVRVTQAASGNAPGVATVMRWGLRSSSTTVAGSMNDVLANTGSATATQISVSTIISGLTPGATYAWKWGWYRTGGSGTLSLFVGLDGNGGTAVATMTVEAVGGTAAATRSAPKSIDDLGDFNEVFGSTYTGHDQAFDAVNSSTLPSGWTWQNQGTSTYRERFGGGTLIHQGDAAWRSIVQSLTGAPSTWDVYAKIGISTNRSGNTEWGILLTDGTVHRIFERLTTTSADQARIAYWSTATSFTSVTGSQDTMIGMRDAYLRVRKNSSTSYDFWVSSDGLTWVSVLTAHNPGLTPTHIGFTVLPPSGIPAEVACHWFRMR